MKISFYIVFLIVSLQLKNASAPEYRNLWVVWNIGQGQWVTHIQPDTCRHYDMGGEFGSFKSIRKNLLSHCGNKDNRIHLSHWDYDHFMNIPAAAKALPRLCWEHSPEFGFMKKSAQEVLSLNIPACKGQSHGQRQSQSVWVPVGPRTTNEASQIFFTGQILITGDSPVQQEKIWAFEIENLRRTKVLILGHHGSRTSTGEILLQNLPDLKFAIASARFQKYRHPHPETLSRLAKYNIPVLKTEDWGNIWFTSETD